MLKCLTMNFIPLNQDARTSSNDQIEHLQEELKSKDKIIKQSLNLLDTDISTELQSRTNIVSKIIEASQDVKKSSSVDTKTLNSNKINVQDKSNCLEKDDIEQPHSVIKRHK